MKKVGLIINPIAGLGGSVGLKGTDNTVEEALRRGAVPMSNVRTRSALSEILCIKDKVQFITYEGLMGGDLIKNMGFNYTALKADYIYSSTREDTLKLAKILLKCKVDLIIFSGGDGTARDVFQAIGEECAVIGIPSGVKIHSPVYAKTPKAAGYLAKQFIMGDITITKEEEVLDIDENLYRRNIISTKLFGYLKVPMKKSLLQNSKCGTPLSEAAAIISIAHEVVDNMEDDTFYIIGAGTTTRAIMNLLRLKNTLIGVDLIYNKKLIANDLYGEEIFKYIKNKKTKLIVTVTGGQGYLFGRGNQQITPEVIKKIGKENLIILATKEKIYNLHGQPLMVDTIDEELNKSLCGYYKVITSYNEYIACKVSTI